MTGDGADDPGHQAAPRGRQVVLACDVGSHLDIVRVEKIDQVLELTVVAGQPGRRPSGDGVDPPRLDVLDHALEGGPGLAPEGADIIVDVHVVNDPAIGGDQLTADRLLALDPEAPPLTVVGDAAIHGGAA